MQLEGSRYWASRFLVSKKYPTQPDEAMAASICVNSIRRSSIVQRSHRVTAGVLATKWKQRKSARNAQFERVIRSILEDRCAKCDTSVTVAKIRMAERSTSLWLKWISAAGRSRRAAAAIIFISARATTHLASLCRPRIECGGSRFWHNEIERPMPPVGDAHY